MAQHDTEKKDLTCTNKRTIMTVGAEKVDLVTKRLVDRLNEIERQKLALDREAESITTALEIAQVRPKQDPLEVQESRLAVSQPFAGMSLVETCKTILESYAGQELTKTQVEYLAVRGGYKFSTADPKNSVQVTLRRLADDGYCKSTHIRGRSGNRYVRLGTPPLMSAFGKEKKAT
jgi:hypothetical protein